MIFCSLCDFSHPTCLPISHLRTHGLTTAQYKDRFPLQKLRIFSQQHKSNLAAGLKKSYTAGKSIAPMLGKHHTQETKKKISLNSKGVFNIGNVRQRERKLERMAAGALLFNCEILTIDHLVGRATARCNTCSHTFTYTNQIFYPARLAKIGKLCPHCQPRETFISQGEIEVGEFIREHFSGVVLQNDREVLSGREFDIYLPELKIGIEYTGLFWHSNIQRPDILHLQQKTLLAREHSVELITIFEDEWQCQKDKVKNILHGKITPQINEYRISEIDAQDANAFLVQWSLSIAEFNLALGLYKEDALLGIVTFKDSLPEWEITNLCTLGNVDLFPVITYFQDTFNAERKPLSGIADLRWGGKYSSLGFALSETIPPKVWFLHDRYSQRSIALDDIPLIKRNKETIFDCGYEKWELCK